MKYYPVYYITLATLTDGKLVLSVNGSPTISEHSKFVLRFAPNVVVPSGVVADTPVVLSINGTEYTMYDKYAEVLTAGEMPLTLNKVYFSQRYSIVGGVGSETTTGDDSTTTFYFVAWDIPVASSPIA